MVNNTQLITNLEKEFRYLEELATGTKGEKIKDTLAHLHAWQQVSIARLEAAKNILG